MMLLQAGADPRMLLQSPIAVCPLRRANVILWAEQNNLHPVYGALAIGF
jgi:hypothetical protein